MSPGRRVHQLQRWLWLAGVAGVSAAGLFLACGDRPSPASAGSAPSPGLLFVQTTQSGTWADNGDGTYALTLVAPASLVTVFTDRPDRQAYTIAAETLVARWSSYGFTAVPPNAALVVHRAPADQDTVVVELTAPTSTAGAIRYTARVLDAGAGVFARYASDGQVPGSFGNASLFIDSSGDALFQPLTLQVSSAGPGQRIGIEVGSAGAGAVGWSMGPSFQDSSGVEVTADGDDQPIQELSVTSQEITVWTSSGGGGSSALTTIQLYLAAEAGIETFYLRASADPSIEVTAAIGSAAPQALDQTQTTFTWDPG